MSKRNEVLYLVWSVSGRASINLMSKFIEKYFYDIVRSDSCNRVVYLKDGRIFKFVDEMGYHDHVPVKFKRWNELTDEDFEKEFMNDNKLYLCWGRSVFMHYVCVIYIWSACRVHDR